MRNGRHNIRELIHIISSRTSLTIKKPHRLTKI